MMGPGHADTRPTPNIAQTLPPDFIAHPQVKRSTLNASVAGQHQ